jgi:elongation factor 1-alpha
MSPAVKPHMNLVIIGHIDNGKSTLTGHLLVATGSVSDKELRDVEKVAKDMDKESFKFAFFMDRLAEERKRGITIDLAFRKFETQKYTFTIIDAPGHADFVKNMITGASQADAAILVFSSKEGEFETAVGDNGQGREHAFLAKTLGVKQLIVAFNKMDTHDYSEKRFKECHEEASRLLTLVGYNLQKDVNFIPVSAWTGANIKDREPKLSWFKGPTLLEALDALKLPEKPTGKPLRIPVQDVYKIKGAGVVPVGRVETGICKVGAQGHVAPTDFVGEIKSIEMHHEALQSAEPGDNIGFSLRNIEMKHIYRGCVVAEASKPCSVVGPKGSWTAQIIVIWHPTAVAVGYTPVVHSHTAQIACKLMEIKKKMDPKTGQVTEEKPEFLKKGDAGVIVMQPIKKFPIEKFKDFPELGRVAIRDMARTVAVGVVLDLAKGE